MTEEQLNKHIEEFDKKFWDGLNCLITLDQQPEDSNWRRAAKSEDIKSFFTTKLKQAFKQGEEAQLQQIKEIVEEMRLNKKEAFNYNTYNQAIDDFLSKLNKLEGEK